jgi:phage gp36-like protein
MPYALQSDVENVFSPDAVAAWSRFETGAPGGAADATRIADALAFAQGEIDAFFTAGPYAVPLVCEIAAPIVAHWAAVIAGVWLYGNRSTTAGIDYADNRYIALRNAIYQDMEAYKAGVKRLDAAPRFPHLTAPIAG